MRVGLPKEIKQRECRVGMTPAGMKALVDAGHELIVERGHVTYKGVAEAFVNLLRFQKTL